ncbi:hypothetical protein [Epibacterium sp. Ofav1-8]|uniref:hypothetical protein n=1 Tax=Epibacterium sp. Ofav1-8 TaxID=2917735 RepID=UPI001EF62A37|nr:hypothetical protein [Epibacterium sp. Ofav1-8]MCG7624612.1 hypothetical protein [Epibacterium sp. Ofav1-8]
MNVPEFHVVLESWLGDAAGRYGPSSKSSHLDMQVHDKGQEGQNAQDGLARFALSALPGFGARRLGAVVFLM